YIVSKVAHTTLELRDYLQPRLTDYMMPGHFVPLDRIPLTHNGKVDYPSLPSPEGLSTDSGIEYVAARNEIEQQLVEIWGELLQKQPIGVKDDFFVLGGDSLKALKLISMVQKEFDFKIEFQEVYDQPNISYLATFIESFQILNNQEEDGFGDGNELVF
ncbi:MAG: phosphopantetheine-binding protein, partial [Bacteroidota bacterium]